MKLKVLSGNILLKKVELKTESGLLVCSKDPNDGKVWEVVEVGPDCDIDVKLGDKVICVSSQINSFIHEREVYTTVTPLDIYAVVEEDCREES